MALGEYLAPHKDWTYSGGLTVQSMLNALNPTGAYTNEQVLAMPSPFDPSMTFAQHIDNMFGPGSSQNLNMSVPDPQKGSLIPSGNDLGGFALALAPIAAMVGGAAGVGGLSNAGFGGAAGAGAGGAGMGIPELGLIANPATATTAISQGIPASMLAGGEGALTLAGLGGEGGSWGVNDLSKVPTGSGWENDLGNSYENAVAESANQNAAMQTANGDSSGFFGGLGSFLGGVSPDTWLKLGGLGLSTGLGLYSQNKAVDAQTQAANNALALQAQMYAQNRADLEPWRNAGIGALGQINSQMPEFTRRFGMSDFQADPGYQFRQSEGEKAINRAAQARGLFDSGATMKALDRYNQNLASAEYSNAYNRFTQDQTNAYNKLSNLAGLGQTSARTVADLGQNYANQASGIGMDAGNARASGYIGGANTLANAINQGTSIYSQSQYPFLRSYFG